MVSCGALTRSPTRMISTPAPSVNICVNIRYLVAIYKCIRPVNNRAQSNQTYTPLRTRNLPFTTPHFITSHLTAQHCITSHRITSHRMASHSITSHYVTSHHAMPLHITPHRTKSKSHTARLSTESLHRLGPLANLSFFGCDVPQHQGTPRKLSRRKRPR